MLHGGELEWMDGGNLSRVYSQCTSVQYKREYRKRLGKCGWISSLECERRVMGSLKIETSKELIRGGTVYGCH